MMIVVTIRDKGHGLVIYPMILIILIEDLHNYVSIAVKVYGNFIKHSEKIESNNWRARKIISGCQKDIPKDIKESESIQTASDKIWRGLDLCESEV